MAERNKRSIIIEGGDVDRAAAPSGASAGRVAQRHVRTMTLVAFARLYKVKLKVEDLQTTGEAVVRLCLEKGVRPTEVEDARFGAIRLYPEWLLREFFKVEG